MSVYLVATREENMPDSPTVKHQLGLKEEDEMLQEYKSKTNLFILLGIIVQVVGVIVGLDIGLLIRVAGSVLFIIGCCYYAKGKGYHGAWGLLGLLSLIGLIVLVCMRDKHKA